MIVVLMGVAGAGKTAVGARLAKRLDWPFVDGDDLHPPGNIGKMASGEPLTDEDRLPWLRRVRDVIVDYAASGRSAIVACSALRKSYRRLLRESRAEIRFVYLRATQSVLERRLSERRGHFFDPALLASQLDSLEEPERALVVDADGDLDTVVGEVASGLGLARR